MQVIRSFGHPSDGRQQYCLDLTGEQGTMSVTACLDLRCLWSDVTKGEGYGKGTAFCLWRCNGLHPHVVGLDHQQPRRLRVSAQDKMSRGRRSCPSQICCGYLHLNAFKTHRFCRLSTQPSENLIAQLPHILLRQANSLCRASYTTTC